MGCSKAVVRGKFIAIQSYLKKQETHVHLWWIHVNVWQNQYDIVKLKGKNEEKKKKRNTSNRQPNCIAKATGKIRKKD